MGKRHHKYDYFSAFESLSELAVDEADLLIKAIEDFSTADALKETMEKAHAIEHKGDDINHDIFRNVATDFITPIDHWIAFILLALIGGKMLFDAFRGDDEGEAGEPKDTRLDLKELLMLAIATSIDALAVGITFAFLGVSIVWAIAVIGVTTFVLSVVGVAVGHVFGARYEKGATIAGGIVLILIGCKILLEHLGIIAL